MIRLATTSTIASTNSISHLARTTLMMHGEPAVSTALAHTSVPPVSSGLEIPIADWDDLFHAVQTRLRDVVSPPPGSFSGSPPNDVSDDIRTIVLECVIALDQLHRALGHERKLHQPLVDQALAATRSLAELVGMPTASLAIVQDPTMISQRPATFNASNANASAMAEIR